MRELNSNKTTTFGNVPTAILKQSSEGCSDTLKKLVNDEDDPTKAKNYRPVSLLPGVSKVFEGLMHKQISFYIDQFLSPYMYGLRMGFSTQHTLLSLSKKWEKVLYNKGYGGAMEIDLLKASDIINRDFLITKLHF